MENYIGKFTFLEKVKGSNCNNGEYFIVQQTPCTLYGVKLSSGYGGHELHKFALVGEDQWKVVSAYQDDNAAKFQIAAMEEWADTPKRGGKLQWVESVYSTCGDNARLAKRALAKPAASERKVIATLRLRIYDNGSAEVTGE